MDDALKEARRADFKASVKPKDRGERASATIALRKSARDRDMKRRRRMTEARGGEGAGGGGGGGGGGGSGTAYFDASMKELVAAVSEGRQVPIDAVRGVRKASLCDSERAMLYENAQVMRALVTALTGHGDDVAEEAAWAMTNMSTDHTPASFGFTRMGAMPALTSFLSGERGPGATAQAVWCLSNILSDVAPACKEFLDRGCLRQALYLAKKNLDDTHLIKQVAFLMSNVAKMGNGPSIVEDALQPALAMLRHKSDDVLCDAALTLKYIVEQCMGKKLPIIQRLIDARGVHTLVDLVRRLVGDKSQNSVRKSAVKASLDALAYLTMSDDEAHMRHLVEADTCQAAYAATSHWSSHVRRVAFTLLSNFASDTKEIARTVVTNAFMFRAAGALQSDTYDVQFEVLWFISNAIITLGGEDVVSLLVKSDALYGVVQALDGFSIEMTQNALRVLDCMLRHGGDSVRKEAEGYHAKDALLKLQSHDNSDIAAASGQLLREYFPDGDDGEESEGGAEDDGVEFDFRGVEWK